MVSIVVPIIVAVAVVTTVLIAIAVLTAVGAIIMYVNQLFHWCLCMQLPYLVTVIDIVIVHVLCICKKKYA